ncbi:hypothetical protein ACMTAU_06995, partial [Alcaligenes pakistanensis]
NRDFLLGETYAHHV